MRDAWKKLFQRADRNAYEIPKIQEQIPVAFKDDFVDQRCGALLDSLSPVFKDQGQLFQTKQEALEKARRETAGRPLARLMVDHIEQVIGDGRSGGDQLIEGVANALQDHIARISYQGEEHYLRESSEARTNRMAERMHSAMQGCSYDDIAKQLMSGTALPRAPKQDGLDEGVPL
ncbi:MAG: hypothetical protein KF807_00395 [Xanthobacteraceae bacterium]|nr:hypothetical protein [Xanthobacteraceae bacterium]